MTQFDAIIVNHLISIILPNLRSGGAERIFLNLAKHFVKQGYRVDFVLMQADGELLTQVPVEIRVVDLKARRIRHAFWPLVRYLRQSRPDALIIGMWPLTIIGALAYRLSRIHGCVVVSDHNNLSSTPLANSWVKRLAMRLTMQFVYPLANARLAVSRGVAEDLSRLSGLARDRFKVIYNPVVDETPSVDDGSNPWEGFAGKRIISVGTLKTQKDHQSLIRAFASVNDKLNSTLVILGEGSLRLELERLVVTLGLTDSVHLPGFVIDPAPWYHGADLFVLSSRWEGFGNVIVEALEAGTPVVSTDCPSGPREILEDGRYGRLVPVGDVESLAEAMIAALQEPVDKASLQRRAQDFSVCKIAQQYLDVLFPRTKRVE